ncbi:Dabb family protein [Devosia sp. RR2S18]|uniref:Dabb family protein n=1 Tax=Devosia rhizosphaerae TaxID=3049774 RepID=UPI002540762B|nr:Dabb family protein [Devosia sp. RR2S18]WIJ24103.1 Dabb family protein [Devosia sp. RR2S18]
MIRHCVFVKFRADVSADERSEIYAGLAALVGQIDGLLSADFGPNISPEGRSQGYNDGFIMDLADAAARDRYLADPAHKAAGAKLVAALEGGQNVLMIFDMEVAAQQ